MAGALSHLRVLDMSRVLAGPWCGQSLADLGADVIKVERPGVGDESRTWGPPWVKDGNGQDTRDSTYFTSANRNKRSITVDIARPEGQALIRELVKKVDVLIENYKVGDLKRYGLGYADLSSINPRLVYCSVTGFGQDGPSASRPGYDFIFQGEGGLMSITGERDDLPGGGPQKVGIAVTDILTGLNATTAILAAIEHRHISGRGQYIDMALMDTIVAFGANQIAGFLATGNLPARHGNAHPNVAPYSVFRTGDGHMIIGCGNQGQWEKLCKAMGREELVQDARFTDMSMRTANRPSLAEELEKTLTQKPSAYWLERLTAADVPNGPINNYRQVFEHPQVLHRKLRVDMSHVRGGSTAVVASPLRLSDTPVQYRHAPPVLGQHTAEVLKELLDKDDEEIARLSKGGIV
jgi:crotonobetainyl-CoA:carnitine CoA-transferase CaiB-like acyl-CoA transferase